MVESNQMVKKILELMQFDMLSQTYIYDRMVVHKKSFTIFDLDYELYEKTD